MKSYIIFFVLVMSITLLPQGFKKFDPASSLFSDYKAIGKGDAITIIVVESSKATNSAETTTGRTSDVGLGMSGGVDNDKLPNVDFSFDSNNDFTGGGSTSSEGMVKTKISATIDSVNYMTKNLYISGSRKIVINGEEQIIRIKGVVRPSDVQADNSVMSYNISDAEIIFEGSGRIEDSTEPGLLTKIFHWLF